MFFFRKKKQLGSWKTPPYHLRDFFPKHTFLKWVLFWTIATFLLYLQVMDILVNQTTNFIKWWRARGHWGKVREPSLTLERPAKRKRCEFCPRKMIKKYKLLFKSAIQIFAMTTHKYALSATTVQKCKCTLLMFEKNG